MFCPRCGEPVDEGDRYCGSCGATIRRDDPTGSDSRRRRSLRDRLGGLVGSTRRERTVTAVTVVAVGVAVAAFFALKGGEAGSGEALTVAQLRDADDACVIAKGDVARAALRAQRRGGVEAYTSDLLLAIAQFRSRVRSLDAGAPIADLERALLTAEIEAGALARQAREHPEDVDQAAARLDRATAELESEIAALGLSRCAALQFATRSASG